MLVVGLGASMLTMSDGTYRMKALDAANELLNILKDCPADAQMERRLKRAVTVLNSLKIVSTTILCGVRLAWDMPAAGFAEAE